MNEKFSRLFMKSLEKDNKMYNQRHQERQDDNDNVQQEEQREKDVKYNVRIIIESIT